MLKIKICAICLIVTLAASLLPVMAADQTMTLLFEDVTATDTTTLAGESKIKVSIDGVSGSVSQLQCILDFAGDLNYKSITCLANTEGELPRVFNLLPNAAEANATGKLNISMINLDGMALSGQTDLFILTFAGDVGDEVTLSLDNLNTTYCMLGDSVAGEKIYPAETKEITAAASESANESITAAVKVTLDRVTDFTAVDESGEYAASDLALTLTAENHPNYRFYTILNNTPVSKGGHRDTTVSIPTFLVEDTLIADTYTVTLSGTGYVTYEESGVSFADTLEITNEAFIPGDVDGNGAVTQEDYDLCLAATEDSALATDATDFNRDGKTDQFDLAVFGDDFSPSTDVPGVCQNLSGNSDSDSITLTWDAPASSGSSEITGYIIRYGTDEDALSESVRVNDADTTTVTLSGLKASTRYYISITAVNEAGEGPATTVIDIVTDSEGGSGNGGNGSNGSSSGGNNSSGGGNTWSPGSGSNGGTGTDDNQADDSTGFTDLAGYDWAKDAIVSLNEQGIIQGISETEFAPGSPIKRGDFILLLTRMLSISDPFTENFSDVPADSYYYNAIGSARAAGIAQGSGDTFMPDNSITRQDLIVLAYRAFLKLGYIEETTDLTALEQFSDRDDIAAYAQVGMASMVEKGIIQGSDGGVNPLGNATRAEVAVMCARLLALMAS